MILNRSNKLGFLCGLCGLKLASQLDRGKQRRLVLASERKVFSHMFGMEEETPAPNMKNGMEMM